MRYTSILVLLLITTCCQALTIEDANKAIDDWLKENDMIGEPLYEKVIKALLESKNTLKDLDEKMHRAALGK